MKKLISGVIFLSTLFVSSPILAAPDSDNKSVTHVGGLSARAVPDVIHVGDEVRLVIQAEFPKGFSIEPLSSKTNFAPFELKSIDKPLVAQTKDRVIQTVIVRLTIFEIGDFNIPSFPVVVWNVAGQRAEANAPPIHVKVVEIGKTKKDTGDIRPIKGSAEISLRYLWDWIFGGLLALCTALLIASMLVRRHKEMADLESLLPPHERALLELERLDDHHWIAGNREREHYSELSDILRRYLERRYGFEVMEHTSPEIMTLLKEKNFDKTILEEAREIFENADLVKFAKVVPERALAATVEKNLKHIIEKTKISTEETTKKPKPVAS